MTHTEWIVSIDDDLKDHDEMFVGNVRDGDRLTRCKDCEYYEETDETIGTCLLTESGAHIKGYCSWAERKEE